MWHCLCYFMKVPITGLYLLCPLWKQICEMTKLIFNKRFSSCSLQANHHSMRRSQRKKQTLTSTNPNLQSNAWRAIAIPELLALVVHQLDIKGRYKLMRVSKHFFHSVGPMVWKSVPSLELVLQLIKGVQVRIECSTAPYKYQFVSSWLSLPYLRAY